MRMSSDIRHLEVQNVGMDAALVADHTDLSWIGTGGVDFIAVLRLLRVGMCKAVLAALHVELTLVETSDELLCGHEAESVEGILFDLGQKPSVGEDGL